MGVDRKENNIYIFNNIRDGDFKYVLSAIYNAVEKLKYKDLNLDFSKCTGAYSVSMLPICSYVQELKKSHVDFYLKLPEKKEMERLFINTGWAHLIEPRQYDAPKNGVRKSHVSVRNFRNSDQQQEAVNDIMESILYSIGGIYREEFSAIEWALNEITDNVLNHSRSDNGGLVQMTITNKQLKEVDITVCDSGVGIPETLKDYPGIYDEITALEYAVKEGVTRNEKTNQGNGLFGTFEICRVAKGSFNLYSSHAEMVLNKESVSCKNNNIPYRGTLVNAKFAVSTGILKDALRFGGKIYQTVDYIELKYESEENNLHLLMKDESPSFGTRAVAKPVKQKILNLIELCKGRKIIIDFSDIPVISSSFADEIFGMIFLELGPMKFMQLINIVNTTETVCSLIDRAIKQRMMKIE